MTSLLKEICTPEVGEELVCLSTVKTDATKTVHIKRNNDFSSFQLHFIINFVLTELKLAHGPVKFSVHLISHFVMNIIMAKDWLNHQSKFCQMTYFQQSAKVSSYQNVQPYSMYTQVVTQHRQYAGTRPSFPV